MENPAREDWGLTPRQALFTPQRRMDGRSATLTIVRTALAEAIAGECMSVSFAFLQNIIVTHAHSRRVRKQTLGRMQANRPHTDNRRRPVTVSPGKLGTKVAKIFLQCMCYISLRVSSDVQMFGHYLEELAKKDGYTLKGLQLDILRNEGHNLHKEEVWAWVSQQLESGIVDLFLVGASLQHSQSSQVPIQGIRGASATSRPKLPPWLFLG